MSAPVECLIIWGSHGCDITDRQWAYDEYAPQHTPRPGERIFRDLAVEEARVSAERRVEEYWDHPDYPMSGTGRTKEQWVDLLVADLRPGEPTLVEVTP